ncbi:MAG: NADH-quinone oxidoreductase subunit J [Bacteroidales bacterium]|nr:NADH-quinone oxidoreductase subunit J [Bacteroidales bacterium]MBD5218464.1 NADH-quinone oxidoreductase subunit J [Bacteroidales bacterium]MBD5220911.1 NADH-quinone oxidoreductase subunit J [Bacteroidales bacterium]
MESVGNIILYFIVAIVMVVFSFMTVRTTKILRSATYLLFVLLSTAFFYFQLGYQFLGAVQIAVYAGGIMVLFVFAILLTRRPDDKTNDLTHHRRVLGTICSVAATVLLLFALFKMPMLNGMSLTQVLTTPEITMHDIGHAMLGTDRYQYLLPFEAISVLLLACIIGGVVIARKR